MTPKNDSTNNRCPVNLLQFVLLLVFSTVQLHAQDSMLVQSLKPTRPFAKGPTNRYLRLGEFSQKIRLNVDTLRSPDQVVSGRLELTQQGRSRTRPLVLNELIILDKVVNDNPPFITRLGFIQNRNDSYVQFTISDKSIHGHIRLDSFAFWIYRTDKAGSSDSDPNIDIFEILDVRGHRLKEEKPLPGLPAESKLVDLDAPCPRLNGKALIRVLVLATQAATAITQKHSIDLTGRVKAAFSFINNHIMPKSGVNIYLEYSGPFTLPSFSEGTYESMLTRLQSNAKARKWRRDYDADLVTLLAKSNKAAGKAYVLDNHSAFVINPHYDRSNAYSVVQWSAASTTYTLAHELGHNMGLGHARKYCPGKYVKGLLKDSLGNCLTNGYETIMSRSTAHMRLPFFSNPAGTYGGMGIKNVADAAKTLNLVSCHVATYMN